MYRLLRGFNEFRRSGYPQREELFTKLSQGQQPLALFITCADSRISPNLITNTDPGEIFVLRNAGNLVPEYGVGLGEAATIEYAVKALQVKDIIVCGHSQCGAMSAVLNPQACEKPPAVAKWLADSQQLVERVRQRHGDVPDSEMLDRVIEENVVMQLESLAQHPSVREALDADEISLHGWVYSIGSGDVAVLDDQQQSFVTPEIFV